MATCVVREYVHLPRKRRLNKESGESNSVGAPFDLRKPDPYDDDYIRQYILYYYQYHKSEGFVIDWKNLEYKFHTMPILDPNRICSERTNDELVRDAACRAICQYNADKGTKLVFLDHVSASYRWCAGIQYFITFWALDLASPSAQPTLYQTNCRRCGPTFCEIYVFRPKPTDEEIAAVQVDPPPPLYEDFPEKPTITFRVTGPGSGYMCIPEVEFTRIPAEVEMSSFLASLESWI